MSTTILGAGPIGLASAYELAIRGESVTVISRSTNVGEAAHVNAGWIVPIMSAPVPAPGALKKSIRWLLDSRSPLKIAPELSPGHISFMLSMLKYSTQKNFLHGLAALAEFGCGSLSAFDSYVQQGIDFEIHRSGVLMAFTSQAELDSHAVEFDGVEKYGLAPVKVLSASEMQVKEPMLSDVVKFGIYCSDQYFVDPTSLMNGLRKKCIQLGVDFIEHAGPISLVTKGSRAEAVIGPKTVSSDHVLVAAGASSRELLENIGISIPIRFGKGYCFDFLGEKRIKNSLYLSSAKVAVTPNHGYLRFAGTMEFGGDGLEINHTRAEGILKSSAKYFTENLFGDIQPKSGLRSMTPDGLPVIGKLSGASNLYIASGHAMQGVTLAPNTGHAIADLILDGSSSVNLNNFKPERFSR
jgi:D-amino-acid dehydrogenase